VNPSLFGFRKLASKPYPLQGASVGGAQQTLKFDLKDYLQTAVVSRLLLRVVGTIAQAGSGAGVATGRDNPESLITQITAHSTPAVGAISKNALTARGTLQMGIFDRGYAIHSTALADPGAGNPTPAVDFSLPLIYKMPGSINPIEYGLPLALFTNYVLDIVCGGREQLFTGGTTTWNLAALNVEIWADYDDGVAGNFHLMEEGEIVTPVTQTQPDLQLILEPGYFYTHLLFIGQTALAKDDTLINSINVQSAGRIWTPQGDKNAPIIHRWNQETHVNNAAESLTGTYFLPALRDGMFTRSIDCRASRLEIKFDVTLGGGPSSVLTRYRRIQAQALQVKPAQKAA